MTKTTMVRVRLNERVRAQAEKALAAMGLTMSDAVRLLLTRVAKEQALPFEVRVPNRTTIVAMKEARKGGLRSHESVADMVMRTQAEESDRVIYARRRKVVNQGARVQVKHQETS